MGKNERCTTQVRHKEYKWKKICGKKYEKEYVVDLVLKTLLKTKNETYKV